MLELTGPAPTYSCIWLALVAVHTLGCEICKGIKQKGHKHIYVLLGDRKCTEGEEEGEELWRDVKGGNDKLME